MIRNFPARTFNWLLFGAILSGAAHAAGVAELGREVAIPRHLQDGEEFTTPLPKLLEYGEEVFAAVWTTEDGGGRPLMKGTGSRLSDLSDPLVFPRNFNRISGPDANSCYGCHAQPFGIPGGAGDIVANVFVLGQRFDFATFDPTNGVPTKTAVDERGQPVTLQNIANSRVTIGMFGSGYIEMLARQMTAELQRIRDAMAPGASQPLVSKGVHFGTLTRLPDGSWDTSRVEGLAELSLASVGPNAPPSLIIRPFHQAGRVVSLREFTNNSFNQHHGMQSTERFGINTDPDGDGVSNELTRADVTAVTIFQATMAVPGRVIPNDRKIEAAVRNGEQRFAQIGCAICHRPSLPLTNEGWIFTEPNPYNPITNLRVGDAPTLSVDLTNHKLPPPRLKPRQGVVEVPAFTDLKLHDITSGPDDPNREPLDMQTAPGSIGFFAGNSKFITRKLWGCGNTPPYYHHGQYTTMRQAILAHAGEALDSRQAFQSLATYDQDSIIEFLKTLQVLPPGTKNLIVDENGKKKEWP
jgi:cytochrome c peroxidase